MKYCIFVVMVMYFIIYVSICLMIFLEGSELILQSYHHDVMSSFEVDNKKSLQSNILFSYFCLTSSAVFQSWNLNDWFLGKFSDPHCFPFWIVNLILSVWLVEMILKQLFPTFVFWLNRACHDEYFLFNPWRDSQHFLAYLVPRAKSISCWYSWEYKCSREPSLRQDLQNEIWWDCLVFSALAKY